MDEVIKPCSHFWERRFPKLPGEEKEIVTKCILCGIEWNKSLDRIKDQSHDE